LEKRKKKILGFTGVNVAIVALFAIGLYGKESQRIGCDLLKIQKKYFFAVIRIIVMVVIDILFGIYC